MKHCHDMNTNNSRVRPACACAVFAMRYNSNWFKLIHCGSNSDSKEFTQFIKTHARTTLCTLETFERNKRTFTIPFHHCTFLLAASLSRFKTDKHDLFMKYFFFLRNLFGVKSNDAHAYVWMTAYSNEKSKCRMQKVPKIDERVRE